MIGLEPVGNIPTRANLQNPVLLKAVKKSLWSVLNFSFFRTNDMAVDLKSVNLDGTVPLIMLFAARTGNHLLSVRPVQITPEGQLQPATAPVPTLPNHPRCRAENSGRRRHRKNNLLLLGRHQRLAPGHPRCPAALRAHPRPPHYLREVGHLPHAQELISPKSATSFLTAATTCCKMTAALP